MELSIERLRSPRSPRRAGLSSSSNCSTPFASAPSSPRFYSYFSAPSSPHRRSSSSSSTYGEQEGVPFAWEDRPGTPKRSSVAAGFAFDTAPPTRSSSPPVRLPPSAAAAADERAEAPSSVDYLSSMGFHFSAPVSPNRAFDFPSPQRLFGAYAGEDDEFEFASARMSEADSTISTMSHADELFFQGQLRPLKLPPRLQQQPQNANPKSPTRSPPFKSHHQRAQSLFFANGSGKSNSNSSSLSSEDRKVSKSRLVSSHFSPAKKRSSLKELLHLVPSGSGRQQQQQQQQQSRSSSNSSSSSFRRFSSNPNSRSSSTSSNQSVGRNSTSSRRQVSPVSSRELLHYGKVASKNIEQLRTRTFLPYKQGLLGCLGCLHSSAAAEA